VTVSRVWIRRKYMRKVEDLDVFRLSHLLTNGRG